MTIVDTHPHENSAMTDDRAIGSVSVRTVRSNSSTGAVRTDTPDPINTRRFTRAGCSIAIRWAMKLPIEWPITVARWTASASSKAMASPTKSETR